MTKSEVDKDFEISDKLRTWAVREVPQVDIDRETGTFVDHWLSTGEKKADWDATWRNWMRRSPTMGGYVKSPEPKYKTVEPLSDTQRIADVAAGVAQMDAYRRKG